MTHKLQYLNQRHLMWNVLYTFIAKWKHLHRSAHTICTTVGRQLDYLVPKGKFPARQKIFASILQKWETGKMRKMPCVVLLRGRVKKAVKFLPWDCGGKIIIIMVYASFSFSISCLQSLHFVREFTLTTAEGASFPIYHHGDYRRMNVVSTHHFAPSEKRETFITYFFPLSLRGPLKGSH